jgi:hypothetical protein
MAPCRTTVQVSKTTMSHDSAIIFFSELVSCCLNMAMLPATILIVLILAQKSYAACTGTETLSGFRIFNQRGGLYYAISIARVDFTNKYNRCPSGSQYVYIKNEATHDDIIALASKL